MPTDMNSFIRKIFRIQTKEIAIFVGKKIIITDLMIEEQRQMRENLFFFPILTTESTLFFICQYFFISEKQQNL